MKMMPYWVDSAPEIPSYADRPLPGQADVVVIGGGYTGLSTALHLARKGAEVVLIEQETIGWGASSRNGGHCNAGITIGPGEAVKRYGEEAARRLYQVSLDAVDCVEELVRTEEIDCDFVRCGRLGLASKPAHFDLLRARQEATARYFGHELQLIPRDQLSTEIGSGHYHGALLDPSSGGLHPAKYVRGLAQAAERAGAGLFERARALRLTRRPGSGFAVQTNRGTISAGQVMIATNGYADAVFPPVKKRVLPVGSFVIATEPLPRDLADEISPNRRNMVSSLNFSNYFRMTADDRLIFGGRAKFTLSDLESDQEAGKILRETMTTVFPQLSDVKVEYVWGGTVAFTLDKMPHAGEIDGVYYATGYCGHGVQMATYIGKRMAEVIAGNPAANPWRDIEFPSVPYAFGWRWILPLAGIYYRMKDRVQ